MLHIKYSIWAILNWAAILLVLSSFGHFVRTLIAKEKKRNLLKDHWIGIIVVTTLLHILHIFFPINQYVYLVFLGVSTIYSLYRLVTNFQQIKSALLQTKTSLSKPKTVFVFITAILLILTFSHFVYTASLSYDSALYYRSTINSIVDSNIVVGLANIHARLGFNNSSFLSTGLFSSIDATGQEWRFVSSALIIFQLIYSFSLVLKKKKTYREIYYILFIPILIHLSFISEAKYLANASPDTFVFLIQYVIFGEILGLLKRQRGLSNLSFIILMTVLLVTVKISGLVFAITSILVALSLLFKDRKELIKKIKSRSNAITLSLAVSLGILWLIRGFLLSGFILFPSTVFNLNPQWSTGVEIANAHSCAASAWAKQPYTNCEIVNESFSWVRGWIATSSHNPEIIFLGMLTVLAVLAMIILRKQIKWRVLLPGAGVALPSMLFWFLLAPDIRFARAALWMIPIIILLSISKKKYMILLFLISIIWAFDGSYRLNLYNEEKLISNTEQVYVECNDGIQAYNKELCRPEGTDQCYDNEAFCGPEITTDIKIDDYGIWKVVSK